MAPNSHELTSLTHTSVKCVGGYRERQALLYGVQVSHAIPLSSRFSQHACAPISA
jgi:hypothetical protein